MAASTTTITCDSAILEPGVRSGRTQAQLITHARKHECDDQTRMSKAAAAAVAAAAALL